MAFQKKTWLARLGQGLNKFSIDGATPVPIINQPDSVTQQGDALSAGNLNDLEQRIADAFDDVEERKADKSTTDALQSQINQQDARLDQHESRLENLEQKAGDYSTVQYRGTNAVPTGKASYGLVKNIVGKSRAWNQLVKNGNFADSSNWSSSSNGSLSVSGNKAILTANDTNAGVAIRQNLSLLQGHKYLISYYMTPKTRDGATRVYWGGNNVSPVMYTTKDVKANHSFIFEAGQTASSYCLFYLNRLGNVVGDVAEFENINCYDLTLIFGAGNEPSTVADALAQLSALGEYNPYDAGSLVSEEVSGVESVGVNIWDEVAERGGISSSDGNNYTDASLGRSKNYIPVKPNTAYYVKTSQIIYPMFYDGNKGYIGFGGGSLMNETFTTPQGCYYMRFVCDTAIADNSIQICLNSYADKTTYHPYKTDTLSLSETVTLRSAGSVADELDVESGVITRKVGSVDLGTLDLSYTTNTENVPIFYADISGFSGIANLLCELYVLVGQSRNAITNDREMSAWNSSYFARIAFSDSRYTDDDLVNGKAPWLEGVILNYELATPTTESIDPITDNFIKVEGGGTINTIQEQTPVIDNCLDVGYLTV